MRDKKVGLNKNCRHKKRQTVQVRILAEWHIVLKEEAKAGMSTISKILDEIMSNYYGKDRIDKSN